MKKALDFNTYKRLKKMSFNDMNRWIRSFWNAAYHSGIDDAVENGVVEVKEQTPESVSVFPDNLDVAICDEDLFDLLVSVNGIGEKRAVEIMNKMKEFGVDESLFEEVDDDIEESDGDVGDDDAPAR